MGFRVFLQPVTLPHPRPLAPQLLDRLLHRLARIRPLLHALPSPVDRLLPLALAPLSRILIVVVGTVVVGTVVVGNIVVDWLLRHPSRVDLLLLCLPLRLLLRVLVVVKRR